MSERKSLLIVDDDKGLRDSLAQVFQEEGYQTYTAKTGQEAVAEARRRSINVALIDIRLPDTEGIELMRRLRSIQAEIAGIIITGYASVQNAVAALNEGADGYLLKPVAVPRLKAVIQEALAKQRSVIENRQRLSREMWQKEHYRQLSILDGLTQVYNYRYFQEMAAREITRAKRYARELSLMIIDIDDFKEYNDRCGHPAGDKILKKVGQVLKRECRSSDFVARYGGDEFAIILPETNEDGAITLARRLRQSVQETNLSGGGLTISIGLASYPSDAQDKEQLIFNADKALYLAKRRGKNEICTFGHREGELERV